MMKKINAICLLLLLTSSYRLTAQNHEQKYQNAIHASMYPPNSIIDTNLVNITKSNKNLIWKTINNEDYVLMVSWKAKNYYGDSGAYNTGPYQIWVTAAPQLKEKLLKEIKQTNITDTSLRLKQMLGLPPNATYNYFIEFWVKPADMFRPCPDKEITDKKCNLCFNGTDSLDQKYIQWINESRIARYYACGLYNQYPWTQLGYTYDWNETNKTHIGLSEFVIDTNKTIYINKVYKTNEYLK